MGSRCLLRWMKQPLQDLKEINRRLNAVESLIQDGDLLEHFRDAFLRRMPDLDKLFIKFYKVKSQIKRHNAGLSDVVKVYNFVLHSANIIEYLSKFFGVLYKCGSEHEEYQGGASTVWVLYQGVY